MTTVRDVVLAKKSYNDVRFEQTREIFRGKIVAVRRPDNSVSPFVEGKPGFVWVRSEFGNAYEVFNREVTVLLNLEVLVGRSPKPPHRLEILQWNDSIIISDENYTGSPYLATHHTDHEQWDGGHGPDPVTVYPRMLAPLKTFVNEDVSLSNPTDEINVSNLLYINEGEFVGFNGINGLSIASAFPTVGYKRFLLIYLDRETNTIMVALGTEVPNIPGLFVPYPSVPNKSVTSALILVDNQTGITDANIIDARIMYGSEEGGVVEAEEIGQVLFSTDGIEFTPRLPLTSPTGWVVEDNTGILLIVDVHGS